MIFRSVPLTTENPFTVSKQWWLHLSGQDKFVEPPETIPGLPVPAHTLSVDKQPCSSGKVLFLVFLVPVHTLSVDKLPCSSGKGLFLVFLFMATVFLLINGAAHQVRDSSWSSYSPLFKLQTCTMCKSPYAANNKLENKGTVSQYIFCYDEN